MSEHAAAVRHLLDENGGKVWQNELVAQLGLTKGGVSQLLKDMEESGTIERITLGRANLVCLPGDLPDAYGPPEEFQS